MKNFAWGLATAVVALLTAAPSQAALLLDIGAPNQTTFRGIGDGPGQGVAVTSTTNLSSFAIDLAMPDGGDAKFMIWNGTNTALLYSEVDAVAAGATLNYVSTSPLNFTLNAGSTYYFGVIGDNGLNVGYFVGAANSAPGLVGISDANTNYESFSSPTYAGGGGANIGLRLFGGAPTTVPEPLTLSIFGAGLAGVALLRRRQKDSKA